MAFTYDQFNNNPFRIRPVAPAPTPAPGTQAPAQGATPPALPASSAVVPPPSKAASFFDLQKGVANKPVDPAYVRRAPLPENATWKERFADKVNNMSREDVTNLLATMGMAFDPKGQSGFGFNVGKLASQMARSSALEKYETAYRKDPSTAQAPMTMSREDIVATESKVMSEALKLSEEERAKRNEEREDKRLDIMGEQVKIQWGHLDVAKANQSLQEEGLRWKKIMDKAELGIKNARLDIDRINSASTRLTALYQQDYIKALTKAADKDPNFPFFAQGGIESMTRLSTLAISSPEEFNKAVESGGLEMDRAKANFYLKAAGDKRRVVFAKSSSTGRWGSVLIDPASAGLDADGNPKADSATGSW